MARVTYGAIVTSIHGSIGGTTFQSNAYGFTIKAKPNVTRPNRPNQNTQKRYLAVAQSRWKSLTDAQRADWDTWATTYPRYSNNNPTAQLTGYAMFIQVQMLNQLGGSVIWSSTLDFTFYTVDTLTYDLKLDGSTLYFVIDSDNESGEFTLPFQLSRPLTVTQNFVGTKPRFIGKADNLTQNFNVTSQYTALFGSLPVIGSRVAYRVTPFIGSNGQVEAPQTGIITVSAL